MRVRVCRQGDEPDRASGRRVGALEEFIGYIRGVERAAADENSLGTGSGGGVRPTEKLAELEELMRRTIRHDGVPTGYCQGREKCNLRDRGLTDLGISAKVTGANTSNAPPGR